MNLVVSADAKKKYLKLTKNNSKLQTLIDKKLALFQKNQEHPSLRIHKLSGNKREAWSLSINKSLRVVFYYIPEGVLIVDLGSHDEVY